MSLEILLVNELNASINFCFYQFQNIIIMLALNPYKISSVKNIIIENIDNLPYYFENLVF